MDSIRAVATLAGSSRVKSIVMTIATLVILPAVGWVSGKLDTKLEVDRIETQVSVLSGKVAALESQRGDLIKRIDALTAPPASNGNGGGPIFWLEVETKAAHRTAVRALGAALAWEKKAERERKLKAADDWVHAYDTRLTIDHYPARQAAVETIAGVALP